MREGLKDRSKTRIMMVLNEDYKLECSGIGGEGEKELIKDILCKEKPDIVVFQETRKESIERKLMGSVWGVRFKDWTFLPSIGRSGGILMVWDTRVVRGVEVLLGAYSVPVRFQTVGGGSDWWFSGIYGPCQLKERKNMWEELAGLYGLCGERWCLGGNFNVARFPSEKSRGGECQEV